MSLLTDNKKPRPRLLDQREKKAEQAAVERAENMKVRKRSGRRCEAMERFECFDRFFGSVFTDLRCRRYASQIHHLLGGNGRRGKGESALAENKQHVCAECHLEITRHVLVLVSCDPKNRAATAVYERKR